MSPTRNTILVGGVPAELHGMNAWLRGLQSKLQSSSGSSAAGSDIVGSSDTALDFGEHQNSSDDLQSEAQFKKLSNDELYTQSTDPLSDFLGEDDPWYARFTNTDLDWPYDLSLPLGHDLSLQSDVHSSFPPHSLSRSVSPQIPQHSPFPLKRKASSSLEHSAVHRPATPAEQQSDPNPYTTIPCLPGRQSPRNTPGQLTWCREPSPAPAVNNGTTSKRRRPRPRPCLKCKAQHYGCDGNTPCGVCQQRSETAAFSQPCSNKSLIHDTVAFRRGCSTLGLAKVGPSDHPIFDWSGIDPRPRQIRLILPFAPKGESPVLDLDCRIFVPHSKYVTALTWMSNGTRKELDLPRYAIHDWDVGYKAVVVFLNRCQPALHKRVMDSTTNNDSLTDEIRRLTLIEARRYADSHCDTTVEDALKIRDFAVKRVALHEAETLDIPVVNDRQSRHHETRPIPRLVNVQIELMVNQIIDDHRKVVTKRLTSLIFGVNYKQAWFEIYLSFFLILDTLEFAYQWQLKYVGWAEHTPLYGFIDSVTNYMLSEWQDSAENIIAHFRCALRGQNVFSRDLDKNVDGMALDQQSLEYLRKTNGLVTDMQDEFEKIRETTSFKLHKPFVWLSQLFLRDEKAGG